MNADVTICKDKEAIAASFEEWRTAALDEKRRNVMLVTADLLMSLLAEKTWTRFQVALCIEQAKELIWILGYAPYLKEEAP